MGDGDFQVSKKWYGEAVTRDDAWHEAAKAAAKCADAFNVPQVVQLMASDGYRIPIEGMDDWCEEARWAFPCLFKSNVVAGLGTGTHSGTPVLVHGVDIRTLTPRQYRKLKAENPDD